MAGVSSLQRGMEEAPENGKELSHSAHANGMNERGFTASSHILYIYISHIILYYNMRTCIKPM